MFKGDVVREVEGDVSRWWCSEDLWWEFVVETIVPYDELSDLSDCFFVIG